MNRQLVAHGLRPIAPVRPHRTGAIVTAATLSSAARRVLLSPPLAVRRVGMGGAQPLQPAIAGPTVVSTSYVPGTLPEQIAFTFSEDVAPVGSFTWVSAATIINLNTGLTVTPTASYASNTVTYGLGATPLSNGNYVAILRGSAIQGTGDGVALQGSDGVVGDDYLYGSPTTSTPQGVFYLTADLNSDRTDNLTDLLTLTRNFGHTGATFAQGDANYDGTVNMADFLLLTRNFGTTVAMLGSPGAPTVTSGTNPVQITWPASSDPTVTAYDVYREDAGHAPRRIASGVTTTSFTDRGAAVGTYTYFVVSRDALGNSSYPSAEVTAAQAVPPALPIAPETLVDPPTGGGGTGHSGAVRYSDGTVAVTFNDLDPAEAGLLSGHTRTWTDQPGISSTSNGVNGTGEVVSQWPSLQAEASGSVAAAFGASSLWFDPNGSGGFNERFDSHATLSPDGAGAYRLLDSAGNLYDYFGFGSSIPAIQRGQLSSLTDPAGNVTSFAYSPTTGQLQTVTRQRLSDNAVLERLSYSYYANGQLQSVEMDRLVGGSLTAVRSASYEYYDGSTPYGQAGQLSRVTVTSGTPTGSAVNHALYRYDTGSGLLTYAVEGSAYEQLAANVSDPMTAPNGTVGLYADYAFTYYGPNDGAKNGKVKTQTLSGGKYTFTYDYLADTGATDLNTFRFKTLETLPDGNSNTVYTNYAGQVILNVFSGSGQPWATAYQYDSAGRVTLSAQPSALTVSFATGEPTVLSDATVSPAVSWYLNPTGLERLTDYYPSTTATDTSGGGAAGYVHDTYVRQGFASASVVQSTETYYAHPGSNGTIFPLASDTAFGNTDGTDARTTAYTYGWRVNGAAATDQPLFQTISLPVVIAAQNGSGQAEPRTQYFDAFGRINWTMDALGFIQYTAYDDATGAVTKTIDDVDTTKPANFLNKPAGWATPVNGGLNLTTILGVDGLGRTTSMTDPNGQTTTTQYIDSAAVAEVITTPPTVTMGTAPLVQPPTRVTRDDRAHGDVYTFTVDAGSSLSVESMSRSHFDPSGQLAWSERFPDTLGLAQVGAAAMSYVRPATGQSTTPGLLSIGTVQGYATLYGYDVMGRQNLVTTDVGLSGNPSGTAPPTITTPQMDETVYDSRGRVSSLLTGTDLSNLTQTTANEYDNGGVGDGDLTKMTQFPGGTQANRLTQTAYDFRDRAIFSETGVGAAPATHPPLTYSSYDNLDEVTDVRVFDAGGITFSAVTIGDLAGGVYAGDLRSWKQSTFDDRGRIYQTLVHGIDQTSGADAGALKTNTFYDPRGLVSAVFSPNGLAQKSVYDSVGRVSTQYTSDGGGTNNGGVQVVNYASANSVTNDVVLQQVQTRYDNDGNPTFVITFQRHHDDMQPGALTYALDASGYTYARISFKSSYYDEADRLIASIDWGNMGDDGASIYSAATQSFGTPTEQDRDASAVSGFDRWLRTDYQYDPAGQQAVVIDPRGIATRTFRDSLGRTTDVTEAYTGSILSRDPSADTVTFDQNRKTQTQYNGADEATAQTSITYNPATPSTPNAQTTTYTYSVVKGGNNALSSNTLLSTTTYGLTTDASNTNLTPVTGLDASHPDVQQVTGYDALGEVTQQINRDGTTHALSYDALGRLTDDHWTNTAAFSTGQISTWADEKKVSYDALGRAVELKMLQAGVPQNDIYNVYDALGNLVTQYQPHQASFFNADGTLNFNPTPPAPAVPAVNYTFDNNYAANYSRQTGVIYPDGREITYDYSFDTVPYHNNTDPSVAALRTFLVNLNNAISRIGFVVDGPQWNPDGSNELEDYDYLGLNTVVTRDHPNGPTGLTYISNYYPPNSGAFIQGTSIWTPNNQDPQGNSYHPRDDAGSQDPYDGLDRFGRVVDVAWNGDTERELAYDADGNLLSSLMLSFSISQVWMSESYYPQGANALNAYDHLNRYQAYYRGWMNAGSGTAASPWNSTVSQAPIYENNGTTETVPALYSSKDSFATNGPTGNYSEAMTATDANGNSTDFPQANVYQKAVPSGTFSLGTQNTANERDLFLTFDAWGELASQSQSYLASNGSGAYSFVGTYTNAYQFDALGRRVSETTTDRNGGTQTSDLYYDGQNVIQEGDRSTGTLTAQYVWCPVQSGMMILRDSHFGSEPNNWGIDSHGNALNAGLDLRMYVSQGPDGSVWEISGANTSSSSVFQEQFVYDPNGQVAAIDFDSINGQFDLFAITSEFDFRYLWKGGRAGRDQISGGRTWNGTAAPDPNNGGSYHDVFDGTYHMPNGAVYDTHASIASPLQSDKYAFFRTTSADNGLNSNQYGTRSFVNATFGSNGTASNLQDLRLQMALTNIEGGFDAMLTFGASFVGNVAGEIGGIGQGIYNTFAHPINTYNGIVNNVAGVMTRTMTAVGNEGFTGSATALATGTAYLFGNVTGGTGIAEGIYGQNFSTGQNLSTEQRVTRGFGGLSGLAFFSVGALLGGGVRRGLVHEVSPMSYMGGQPLELGLEDSALSYMGGQPLDLARGNMPLGFESAEQFQQAVVELRDALDKSGINDATIGIRGSSVTGESSAGVPFGPHSDLDFFIESRQLTEGLRTSRTIPGFVYPSTINRSFSPIAEWARDWSDLLGRKVSIGGFQPGTVPTGPSIRL